MPMVFILNTISLPFLPHVICLQETWFQSPQISQIQGYYPPFYCNRPDGQRRGGCAIYTKIGLQAKQIQTSFHHQSVAIQVYLGNTDLIILNTYIPEPQIQLDDVSAFLREHQSQFFICGDFNSHHSLWGSSHTDTKGKKLLEFSEEHNLVLLNDGSGTRLGTNGQLSPLDLTFASPQLAVKCTWEVLPNECNSDHFPIRTNFSTIYKPPLSTRTPHWVLKRADWKSYSNGCLVSLTESILTNNIESDNKNIVESILEVASHTVPQSQVKEHKPQQPWWNSECSKAFHERNRARNRAGHSRLPADYIAYKQKKAILQKTVKKSKTLFWQNYVSDVSKDTHLRKIWSTAKKLNNLNTTPRITPLHDPLSKESLTSFEDKANLLAKTFSDISSDNNYNANFIKYKEDFEASHQSTLAAHDMDSPLNSPFSISELNQTLKGAKDSKPGQDNITYSFLKYLPEPCKLVVLAFFNNIWQKQKLPSEWKHAIIIPLPKIGKDPSSPFSYRPIALTSCLCKTMEKMVNARLLWYLEKNSLISPNQSGFRKNRSTLDQLIALEDSIHTAFLNKEYNVNVFLDFEKAYDMLWRGGLLYKLKQLNIDGNIFGWITDFLSSRKIQVLFGNTLSHTYDIQNGTPQGSVISPTLFNVMVNDLPQVVSKCTCSQFADDTSIRKSNRNLSFAKKSIEEDLENVSNWCERWGFKLSQLKTKLVVFTHRTIPKDFTIQFMNSSLPLDHHTRVLGLFFDCRLSWQIHIDYLIQKSYKIINLLRYITGTQWGCHGPTLLQLYRALMRSRLDYGSQAYNSASNSMKKKLDVVVHKALRLCIGATTTTPILAMHVETGELPLQERRDYLILKYYFKLLQAPKTHPLYPKISGNWFYDILTDNHKQSPFFHSVRTLMKEFSIPDIKVMRKLSSPIPPWNYIPPIQHNDLTQLISKNDSNPNYTEAISKEYIERNWSQYMHIYTDGSKIDKKCAASFCIPTFHFSKGVRLPDCLSIHTCELIAILLALDWIQDTIAERIVVLVDSISALEAIFNPSNNSKSQIILDILHLHTNLTQQAVEIHYDWIPSHMNIYGNDWADSVAKQGTFRPEVTFPLDFPVSDIIPIIRTAVTNKFQTTWEKSTKGRHYFKIQNRFKHTHHFFGKTRSAQVNISRLRLGHAYLANTLFLLGKHPTGICECQAHLETVDHFLISCPLHTTARQNLIMSLSTKGISLDNSLSLLSHQAAYLPLLNFLSATGKKL
ncbi:reverse transcriptase domain-containing protein [Solemya elarraichensis gill symbiont]|uniref:Reverse transcriptase domain-containing protein n=1 Tax=Solemya elarraichensis gill symbiont TaxID=1918949 RepID=A0A1T2L5V8_9GAMM|nr:reverse transcriptase domain-containing protein [Solemya elarraichensis gill symbiont]OOZ40505.1 hypothetical protein BOW52_05800 [Solemya elarraichensis gill symbiont]